MTTLRPLRIVLPLVVLVAVTILAFWMGWRFKETRSNSKHYLWQARFAQIEAMLLMYHEKHGAFPPIKFQSEAGGPFHSWRVLLVPYTSRSFVERYSHYDFSLEWNSTNNFRALDRMPHFSYFSMDGDSSIAHYLAIDDDSPWPAEKPLMSHLITKGKDRFLVVQYPDSEIHWMEPKY